MKIQMGFQRPIFPSQGLLKEPFESLVMVSQVKVRSVSAFIARDETGIPHTRTRTIKLLRPLSASGWRMVSLLQAPTTCRNIFKKTQAFISISYTSIHVENSPASSQPQPYTFNKAGKYLVHGKLVNLSPIFHKPKSKSGPYPCLTQTCS